jgi:hypothetical protein
MATTRMKAKAENKKTAGKFSLPFKNSRPCPVELLELDLSNPRLQTGLEIDVETELDLIKELADIAALDELVISICTNTYLNLEPLIVIGSADSGPFKVLEGNRRLAAIKLIRDPELAAAVNVKLPSIISAEVRQSIQQLLVYRVENEEDARAFIGFKHINGPQRWDAYAKARYVTQWYKKEKTKLSVDTIAAKMGDNNNTLRAYIYSILLLDQVEGAGLWTISDKGNSGRFAFSHLYTALGRKEYQEFLGLDGGWSDKPPLKPLAPEKLPALAEALTFIYGSRTNDRPALVRSQNPDLKELGTAIVNRNALLILRNKGSLEQALDALKDPSEAFVDALTVANLRVSRAIAFLPKYPGGSEKVDTLIEEIYQQADTLHTMNLKKKKKVGVNAN